MTKTAVVLFNLGGPDSPQAVKPFLRNLFSDPAILRMPAFLRRPLAWWISTRRAAKARGIYQEIGGRSPILEHTQAQAAALENALKADGGEEYKVFVSMRYWHPMSETATRNVQAWQPDRIILLPLYPQLSTTTTSSSFADWNRSAAAAGLDAPTSKICCYPTERHLIAAHVSHIKDAYWKASEHGKPRILFSAHGLPERIARDGDPYGWQVKESVAAIVRVLAIDHLDYVTCYQSRVGRLKWITPYTEDEIERAGRDGAPLVIVPVSFVSEHSETLVELDIEYRTLAAESGVPAYHRVPALGTDAFFIEGLAALCRDADKSGVTSHAKMRLCPRQFTRCPCYA